MTTRTPSLSTAAVLLAGGSGTRVQEEINKVYLPLGDRPIILYPLETLDATPDVRLIVVVHRAEDEEFLTAELGRARVTTPVVTVLGGETRHRSEHAALVYLANHRETFDLIAIHDAARPFLTTELIDRLLGSADADTGVIPVLDPGHPIIGRTGATAPVTDMVRVQTPQIFPAAPLISAYQAAAQAGFDGVDTAETVERFSDIPVRVVRGDPNNIKITFIEDIFEAESLAPTWEAGHWT